MFHHINIGGISSKPIEFDGIISLISQKYYKYKELVTKMGRGNRYQKNRLDVDPEYFYFTGYRFFVFWFVFFFCHVYATFFAFKASVLARIPTTNDLAMNSISLASLEFDTCPTIIIFHQSSIPIFVGLLIKELLYNQYQLSLTVLIKNYFNVSRKKSSQEKTIVAPYQNIIFQIYYPSSTVRRRGFDLHIPGQFQQKAEAFQ